MAPPELFSLYLLITVGFLAIFALLVFKFWPRSGKLGINTNTVYCPQCSLKAPIVRTPKNLRQALYGGWTCAKCGCEFDKYGVKVKS